MLIQSIPSSLNFFLPKEWNNFGGGGDRDGDRDKKNTTKRKALERILRQTLTIENCIFFLCYQLWALLISLPQPMQWNVPFRGWVSN